MRGRPLNATYAYVIIDRNEQVVEIWGSRLKVWKRCEELAGIEDKAQARWTAVESLSGTVYKAGDPYRCFTWRRMPVHR